VALAVARFLKHLEDKQIDDTRQMLRAPTAGLVARDQDGGEIISLSHQNIVERRKSFIYTYILEQGIPIHIQELFRALQDSDPELVPDSPTRRSSIGSIASLLARDTRFSWAGPSTWGLTEWGYLTQEMSIKSITLELLRSANEPMQIGQIAKALSHLYRFDKNSIRTALKGGAGTIFSKDTSGKWSAIV
jgi:hypothetical protein